MHLMRRHSLFGSREQEQRGQPFRQRDFGALENRLDGDRELLAAGVALINAGAVLFARQLGHVIASRAAVRAYRAIRPNPCLIRTERQVRSRTSDIENNPRFWSCLLSASAQIAFRAQSSNGDIGSPCRSEVESGTGAPGRGAPPSIAPLSQPFAPLSPQDRPAGGICGTLDGEQALLQPV
jgi:hypothetical protein